MIIEVNKDEFGKINIELDQEISNKQVKYIKSLAYLQLACASPQNNNSNEQFNKYLDIIEEAVNKAKELYNENGDLINNVDPFEQF